MGKGSNTTTTQQQQNYAPTGAGYITGALNQAQNAAQLPFSIPQAPVAGFSQDQQSAFGNINNAQGMAQPYINQAQQYFSPQGAQQFFNPYADAVTAQMQNIFGQQNQQNTSNLVQSAGGVGADRIAVGQGNLANQQGLAAGQTYANLYGQAAQQAQSAGYGTAALGSQAQNAALQGSQAQLASGGLQQQLQQAQLNSPYQQQLAKAAFPYQQAQFLAGITGSLAPGLGGTTSGTGSTTGPAPSMLSQILGLGTAAAGAAGGSGAFGSQGSMNPKGSSPSYGGGNFWSGDAYGGSSSNPQVGLGPADYGAGFARGGDIGFDEGGATSSPFDLPPNFNDKPINVAEHSIIPTVQTPAIRPEVPKLNLTPPAPSGGGGGSAVGDIAKIAQMAMMFANRGGRVNPYGFADGGAAFGTLSPGEEAERPPNILNNAVSSGIGSLATLPRRAIEASAQDVQHLGDPDYQRQSIGPALETAMTMTGGAGAIPAEANSLRAGLRSRILDAAYAAAGGRWNARAKISDIHKQMPDVHLDDLHREMKLMQNEEHATLMPLDNYRERTAADDTSALQIAGNKRHILWVERDPRSKKHGGRVNPYARGGVAGFGPGGEVTDEERALGYQMLREGMGTRAPDSIPGGEPAPEPYRMPDAAAVANWRRGADAAMADGTGATPVGFKPAFPPPSGSHGRSVGQPFVEQPADAPQDVSARSRTLAAPQPYASAGQQDVPSGKSDRFIDSPWAALMAAGLGIAGGTSPFAAVNIGQGGLQGLKTLQEQRSSGQKDETIAQATRRLDLEAKHQETLAANKREAGLAETKPIKVGIDAMGHDILGVRDKDTGVYVDPITRKPVLDPNARAPSYNIPPGGKEDEAALPPHARLTEGVTIPEGVDRNVLARVPPDVANTIRAIDEGRANLSSIPMKDRAGYLKLVNEYDPNWNQNLYSLRKKQNDDLSTNGNAGKMLLATNQLLPHLNSLGDRADKLDNGNYPGGNVITNWFATQRGDPRVKDFQTIRTAAANDAARLLRGTGQMAEKDIEEWRNNFNEAGSPAQLQTAIATLSDDLIGARVSSIQHAYRMNMRMEPPEMVSKEAQTSLAAIKARAEKANAAYSGKPAAAAPAAAVAPPAAAPPAAAAKPPTVTQNGHTYVLQPDGSYK